MSHAQEDQPQDAPTLTMASLRSWHLRQMLDVTDRILSARTRASHLRQFNPDLVDVIEEADQDLAAARAEQKFHADAARLCAGRA